MTHAEELALSRKLIAVLLTSGGLGHHHPSPASLADVFHLLGGIMQQLDDLKANLHAVEATVQQVHTKIDALKAGQVPQVDPADVQAVADEVAAVNASLQGMLTDPSAQPASEPATQPPTNPAP